MSEKDFIEFSEKEANVIRIVERYLRDNKEIEPQFLGEFNNHQQAGNKWKGFFAMWMTKGELAVSTNFSLLQTLVEAVNRGTESALSVEQTERIAIVISHQVEKTWLNKEMYRSEE